MNNNFYLAHYGVKGMKWGVRKDIKKRVLRGHAGPGGYLTKKRQLAGDKKDLEGLKNGQHLSVGFTKKRQAAYDARDKAALEKRIAKNEKALAKDENKKNKPKSTTLQKVTIGAAAAVTILSFGAMAASTISQVRKSRKFIERNEEAARIVRERNEAWAKTPISELTRYELNEMGLVRESDLWLG